MRSGTAFGLIHRTFQCIIETFSTANHLIKAVTVVALLVIGLFVVVAKRMYARVAVSILATQWVAPISMPVCAFGILWRRGY
jgi:hypothetical protein